MKVLALYSSKGGVGKSTASVNLSFSASEAGRRTLLIDLDRVGTSSYCLQVKAKKSHGTDALLKGGDALLKQIRSTDFPSLDVLPPSSAYSNLPLLFEEKKHAKKQLRKKLKELEKLYDLVIIDTPPSLDLIADNVLLASDLVLVPVLPNPFSILGLTAVYEKAVKLTIDRGSIKHFISQFDRRKKMQQSIVGDLMKREGCMQTIIPCSSAVERMALLQDPVHVSERKNAAALAYKALYKEIFQLLYNETKEKMNE